MMDNFTNMTIDKKTGKFLLRLSQQDHYAKLLLADGKQPKRRGPKPDSKPAANRRQELNRQAQR